MGKLSLRIRCTADFSVVLSEVLQLEPDGVVSHAKSLDSKGRSVETDQTLVVFHFGYFESWRDTVREMISIGRKLSNDERWMGLQQMVVSADFVTWVDKADRCLFFDVTLVRSLGEAGCGLALDVYLE